MSLITSTAPSMQPDGPLAQLTSDEPEPETAQTPPRPQSQRSSRPSEWFARIGRAQAHQKSLSLHSGLNLDIDVQPGASLASPFDDSSNRLHLLQSMSTTKSLGRTGFSNKNGKRPSLDSPFEMTTGAPTMPRSLKRRFKSDEEKPRRPVLADVFGPPAEDSGVVRNRGFSVGAVRANDKLAELFEPPQNASPPDHDMSDVPSLPDTSQLGPIGSRSVPRRLAEPVPRLGSPFLESQSAQRPFNTFPRNFMPTASNPQPFHQRLRELAAMNNQKSSN